MSHASEGWRYPERHGASLGHGRLGEPLHALPVLVVRELSKTYRAGLAGCTANVRALDDVHLEVRQREVVALIGPRGAGKTTLLMCASGVIAPDQGLVDVRGPADNGHCVVRYFNDPVQAARASANGIDWSLGLLDNVDQVHGDVGCAFALISVIRATRSHGASLLLAARDERVVRDVDRALILEQGRICPRPIAARSPIARVAEDTAPLTVIPGAPSIR